MTFAIISYRLQHRLRLGKVCSPFGVEVFSTQRQFLNFLRENDVQMVILAGLPFSEYESLIKNIRMENKNVQEILVFEEFVTISISQLVSWEIKSYLGSPKKHQEIELWIENATKGNYTITQNTHPSILRKYLFYLYNHIRRRL